MIDCRDQDNPLDGYVIEEGAVPAALAPFYDFMLSNLPGKVFPSHLSIKEKIGHVAAAASSVVLGPYNRMSSTEKTQCYLIMSHDSMFDSYSILRKIPFLTTSQAAKRPWASRMTDLSSTSQGSASLIG